MGVWWRDSGQIRLFEPGAQKPTSKLVVESACRFEQLREELRLTEAEFRGATTDEYRTETARRFKDALLEFSELVQLN